MRAYNPIETLAEATYSAIHNPSILPDIVYKYQTPQQRRDGVEGEEKRRRPRVDEIELYHFPQTWSSTALGFGGIGGQAITTAYTTIIICYSVAAVFFGGTHAYTVPVTEALMEDLRKHQLVEVFKKGKYSV